MEPAALILGVVSILSMSLAVALVIRLMKTGDGEHGAYLGHQVQEMRDGLATVGRSIQELKMERTAQSGELRGLLTNLGTQMAALNGTNTALREALANTHVRGQWGERMAEDVFRIIGFMEGINYAKQAAIPGGAARPDFTIHMPQGKKLNMDVKFPLDNYMKCQDADSVKAEEQYRTAFLRDVRWRVKEVVSREYIDPAQGTLDYVLVFIPNEQVYQFIQQHGREIIDEALRNKVVLCSPISLFAVLGVIRQAMDNFALEQDSNEILSQFGVFNKQWGQFVKQMDTVGSRIDSAQKGFESLKTTRRRMLEQPLGRIEAIREQKGSPMAGDTVPQDSFDEKILEPEPGDLLDAATGDFR